MRKDRINTTKEFRGMAACGWPTVLRGNEEAPFFGRGYLQRQIKRLSKNGSTVATARQKTTIWKHSRGIMDVMMAGEFQGKLDASPWLGCKFNWLPSVSQSVASGKLEWKCKCCILIFTSTNDVHPWSFCVGVFGGRVWQEQRFLKRTIKHQQSQLARGFNPLVNFVQQFFPKYLYLQAI